MEKAWLGIVSADHAARAAGQNWIQLNHGKRNNLTRLRRGDGFVFYSPTQRLGEKKPLRAVTQLGIVADDVPFQAEELVQMRAGEPVRPWRRRVEFVPARPVPIGDLAGQLDLTREPGWGHSLRFGLVALSRNDFEVLRRVMTV
ncbi:EVE domain-containing protein [Kineosporia rhizophila]|uniref:EVE domain-containing protein n=1 Tax=Kineosporia rhizophila TaxID=84633 RepID=UPI001E2F60AA|nr:EVE domain-containing protein [Kineosporia rhizophila]MCE0536225.1 EVE domain-containing protein [Kineosporia rhizophila]